MAEKTISIRIDEKIHKQIKLRLAENGMTLKDYILFLINCDINEAQKMIPLDNTITEKTVEEAQKVLNFVRDMINHSYGDKKQ